MLKYALIQFTISAVLSAVAIQRSFRLLFPRLIFRLVPFLCCGLSFACVPFQLWNEMIFVIQTRWRAKKVSCTASTDVALWNSIRTQQRRTTSRVRAYTIEYHKNVVVRDVQNGTRLLTQKMVETCVHSVGCLSAVPVGRTAERVWPWSNLVCLNKWNVLGRRMVSSLIMAIRVREIYERNCAIIKCN